MSTDAETSTRQGSLAELQDFVARHSRLFVLSGAGVSTASGIPGYRDRDGQWKRSPPVTLQEFLGKPSARRRYWVRSMLGWPIIAGAAPNAAHEALARLEDDGSLGQLVTQNVDGLHQRAGSAKVLELHGSIGRVRCLECGMTYARGQIQQMLDAANAEFPRVAAAVAPDGDADLDACDLDSFEVPACVGCGGVLKPDVVFFGESVPRDRAAAASKAVDDCDAMLVVGSSLMAYSGYRLCEQAERSSKPIVAINLGRTRADPLLAFKVEQPCAETLAALLAGLGAAPFGAPSSERLRR
jgi:NAD-dependent SIR2 family protein deacetylase